MTRALLHSASDSGKNTVALQAPLENTWCRLPKPKQRLWGISRSTLVEMIERGEIKSTVIKKRNAVRGIRLIHIPSLCETLERLSKGGDAV